MMPAVLARFAKSRRPKVHVVLSRGEAGFLTACGKTFPRHPRVMASVPTRLLRPRHVTCAFCVSAVPLLCAPPHRDATPEQGGDDEGGR